MTVLKAVSPRCGAYAVLRRCWYVPAVRAEPRDDTAPADDDVAVAAPDESHDWSRRACVITILVLAAVRFAASFAVYRTVFPLYSGDRDEGVYVFQAHMLLNGKVSLPAQQYGEFFRPRLTGEQRRPDLHRVPARLAGVPTRRPERIFGSMRIGTALVAALDRDDDVRVRLRGTAGTGHARGGRRRLVLTVADHAGALRQWILTYPLTVFGLTAAGSGLLRVGVQRHRFVDVFLGVPRTGFRRADATVRRRAVHPAGAGVVSLPRVTYRAAACVGAALHRRYCRGRRTVRCRERPGTTRRPPARR